MDTGTIISIACIAGVVTISVLISLGLDRFARWRLTRRFRAPERLLDSSRAMIWPVFLLHSAAGILSHTLHPGPAGGALRPGDRAGAGGQGAVATVRAAGRFARMSKAKVNSIAGGISPL